MVAIEELKKNPNMKEFFQELELQHSRATTETYSRNIFNILKETGYDPLTVKPEEVNTERFKELIVKKKKEGKTNNYINILIFTMRFFSKIYNKKFKMKKLKIPKKESKYITIEQFREILENTFNIRDKALLTLLYCSGLRSSETVNLKVKNLDLNVPALKGIKGKGDKERSVVVIHPEIFKPIMQLYLRSLGDVDQEEDLFKARQKSFSHSIIFKIVEKAGKKIGIKLNPHALRHSFTVESKKLGISAEITQRQLGHSNLKTTVDIYSHMTYQDQIEAVQRINKTVQNNNSVRDNGYSLLPENFSNCPYCKSRIPIESPICPICEKVLKIVCEYCGALNEINYKRCWKCSNKLITKTELEYLEEAREI